MLHSVTTADDLLKLLSQFQYLTIFQLVRLLGKETTINNIRSKVKRLVDDGLVDTQFLPRTSQSGKTPIVYALSQKGIKYQETQGISSQKIKGILPLHHLLQINDVLIASLLLPRIEPAISVFEWRHERAFKQNPIRIRDKVFLSPDGFVHFVLSPPYGRLGEPMGIIFEIDRNTEDVYTIKEKIQNYTRLLNGNFEQVFGIGCLTVAFVITSGGGSRVKQLIRFAEQELQRSKEDAELFLFASVSPAEISPLPFFTSPLWLQPFCDKAIPLIEKRG